MKAIALIALIACTNNIDADFGPSSDCMESTAAKLRTKAIHIDDTFQLGDEAPGAHQIAKFSRVNPDTTVQTWIQSSGTDHVGADGLNELVGLVIHNETHFDTSAGPAIARGIEIMVDATKTGANLLNSTAAQLNAVGGYAIYSEQGSMRLAGDVDLGPGAVQLGTNVRTIKMSSDGSNTERIIMGWPSASPPSPTGSQVVMKNSVAAVSVAGVELALDTTVQSGIRGGFRIHRNAGGSLAGNDSGIAVSGGTGFPFVNSAANQFNVYDELGQGIVFGANTSFTPMWKMTPKDHFVNANVSNSASTPRIPAKSASCDTGGSSSIVGSDFVVRWKMGASATACDITFIQPYTTQIPTCVVTGEAGAGVPTYTTALDKISVSVGVAGATYNAWCFGHLGSQ